MKQIVSYFLNQPISLPIESPVVVVSPVEENTPKMVSAVVETSVTIPSHIDLNDTFSEQCLQDDDIALEVHTKKEKTPAVKKTGGGRGAKKTILTTTV